MTGLTFPDGEDAKTACLDALAMVRCFEAGDFEGFQAMARCMADAGELGQAILALTAANATLTRLLAKAQGITPDALIDGAMAEIREPDG